MKPLKLKLSITLDEDIVRLLKEAAEKDDRSVSSLINIILREYFRNPAKKKSEH